jgi:hypothetical protein
MTFSNRRRQMNLSHHVTHRTLLFEAIKAVFSKVPREERDELNAILHEFVTRIDRVLDDFPKLAGALKQVAGEDEDERERRLQWLAIHKEAARHIDPANAEVVWEKGPVCDPYGIYDLCPEAAAQVGTIYFARSPDSDLWVSFDDLPEATRDALWARLSDPSWRWDESWLGSDRAGGPMPWEERR